MAHFTRGWTRYTPDAPFPLGDMSLKCDQVTATNNGGVYQNTPPLNLFWPLHHSDLRFGYGKDAGGAKDECVATSTGSPVYTLGGNFNDNEGNTYTVYGLRAQRFRTRDLK